MTIFLVLEISPGGGVTIDSPLHGAFYTKALARSCARAFAGKEATATLSADGTLMLQAQPDLFIEVRKTQIIGVSA